MTGAERVRERLVGLLFPRRFPVCERIVVPPGEYICPGCLSRLSPVRQPSCRRCGKEIFSGTEEYCGDCAKKKRSFIRNFALLNYNQAAKDSMAAIKYRNKREYLDFYSRAICVRFGKSILRVRPDILVPVPIHPSRMRSRGFNQAAVLADGIGKQLGISSVPDGLRRVRKTLPQKELDPEARLRNLRGAFAAGNLPDGVETVLLVDDIYTTGSTMEACARILTASGVKKVYGVTICVGSGR